MEKIINISGKEVKLSSTMGTLRRYKLQFKSDFLKDVLSLDSELKKIKNPNDPVEQFSVIDLEIFEQIAWAMAKTANNDIPPIEEWLDEFEAFSIYQVLPEILTMAYSNFANNEKKNLTMNTQNQIQNQIQNQN